MKILMMEPGKHPYPTEIANDLKSLQKAVGGLIQVLYPFDDSVMIVCNEEGKLCCLPEEVDAVTKNYTNLTSKATIIALALTFIGRVIGFWGWNWKFFAI